MDSIESVESGLRERGYVADRALATAVFLALKLGRPLLLEGEAGAGKTELAKVLADALGTRLIRLQCYEGLDVNEVEIVHRRIPAAPRDLAEQVVAFIQGLRRADLSKLPGVAETLDWAAALMALGARELDEPTVDATLGVVLKYQDDIRRIRGEEAALLVGAARAAT